MHLSNVSGQVDSLMNHTLSVMGFCNFPWMLWSSPSQTRRRSDPCPSTSTLIWEVRVLIVNVNITHVHVLLITFQPPVSLHVQILLLFSHLSHCMFIFFIIERNLQVVGCLDMIINSTYCLIMASSSHFFQADLGVQGRRPIWDGSMRCLLIWQTVCGGVMTPAITGGRYGTNDAEWSLMWAYVLHVSWTRQWYGWIESLTSTWVRVWRHLYRVHSRPSSAGIDMSAQALSWAVNKLAWWKR